MAHVKKKPSQKPSRQRPYAELTEMLTRISKSPWLCLRGLDFKKKQKRLRELTRSQLRLSVFCGRELTRSLRGASVFDRNPIGKSFFRNTRNTRNPLVIRFFGNRQKRPHRALVGAYAEDLPAIGFAYADTFWPKSLRKSLRGAYAGTSPPLVLLTRPQSNLTQFRRVD